MPSRRPGAFGITSSVEEQPPPSFDPYALQNEDIQQPSLDLPEGLTGSWFPAPPAGGFGIPPTTFPITIKEMAGKVGQQPIYSPYEDQAPNPDLPTVPPPLPPLPGQPPPPTQIGGPAVPPPPPTDKPPVTAAPPGFDQTKWNDPNHQSDKYKAGRIVAAGGTADDVVQALGPGWKVLAPDLIEAPDGSRFDIYFDYGGPNQRPQWTYVGGGPGTGTPPPNTGPGTGPGTSGSSPSNTLPPGGTGSGGGFKPGPGGGIGGGGFGDTPPPPGGGPPPSPPMPPPGGGGAENDWSKIIDEVLKKFLAGGGTTPFGKKTEDEILQIIQSGGLTPDIQAKLISARENMGLAQRGMLEDASGALADTGGLNVPGIQQGAHTAAIDRITERIAPQYAGAVRDIYSNAIDISNRSLMESLKLATGMSQDEANNILNAIGTGTQRQTALANIALGILDRNIEWNKFLAQFGLDSAKLAEDIQNNRFDRMIKLLELYLAGAGQAGGGHV